MVPSWVRSVTLSRQMRWEADLPDPGDRPELHAAPWGMAFSQSLAKTEDAVSRSPEVTSSWRMWMSPAGHS